VSLYSRYLSTFATPVLLWAFIVCIGRGVFIPAIAIGPVLGLIIGYVLGFERVRLKLTAGDASEGAE
jgi:hypothetical protein